MNYKIKSNEFYNRQNQEIKRFLNKDKKTLHIYTNYSNTNNFVKQDHLEHLVLENEDDSINKIENLNKNYYDLIIITDLFEISNDIYHLLKIIKSKLTKNGKILISTINPRWKLLMNSLEAVNMKNSIKKSSNIKLKKIISLVRSCGFEFNYFYTKQIFPFKVLGLGRFLNKLFELLFFKFNFGIKSYILFSIISNSEEKLTKSVIVPAKNESKNLEILFNDFPEISNLNEIILICGQSKDDTLIVAQKLETSYKNLNIKVFDQKSDGKAGAVFEALEHTTGELIAILDSDISVDPKTLTSFFEIVESGECDFVNGTRLVYPIEDKSMRFLNRLGNNFFKFAVSFVIQNKLSDSLCGTKVFKKTHIEKIKSWRKNLNYLDPFGDFDFLFSAAYSGERILEYPVHYKARVYGKSQINRYKDGLKLIIYFFKSFSRFKSSLN